MRQTKTRFQPYTLDGMQGKKRTSSTRLVRCWIAWQWFLLQRLLCKKSPRRPNGFMEMNLNYLYGFTQSIFPEEEKFKEEGWKGLWSFMFNLTMNKVNCPKRDKVVGSTCSGMGWSETTWRPKKPELQEDTRREECLLGRRGSSAQAIKMVFARNPTALQILEVISSERLQLPCTYRPLDHYNFEHT